MLTPDYGAENNRCSDKILTHWTAITTIRGLRQKGLSVVLAPGVFHGIHDETLDYLIGAKGTKHVLLAGVESDDSAHLIKAEEYGPIEPQQKRVHTVAGLAPVDFAFGFHDRPYGKVGYARLIERYRELNPSALAISDWDPNCDCLQWVATQSGIETILVPFIQRAESTSWLHHYGHV